MAISRTVSEIKGDIFAKFPNPLYLTHLQRVPRRNFVTAVGYKKRPYQHVKKCDDVSTRLDTVPALDRQTDRQNC